LKECDVVGWKVKRAMRKKIDLKGEDYGCLYSFSCFD
jgi:hypothetical protein